MKRSWIKRGKTKLKAKTGLKKESKQKISVLKRKLWQVFSHYIRKRDNFICFTCGRKGEGGGMHSGHFIPKSIGGLSLYFHEENVHAQCYNCNINLSGNQWEYGKKLGEEKVAELYALKQKTLKVSPEWYLEKIKYYESTLKEK